jgi:CDP-diacylglycerol--glycerol-3-phosphate 3-phosphatidyltransferase
MSGASWRGGKRAILLGLLAVVPDFARRFPVETRHMAPPDPAPPVVWRHVPNALSLARIVCAPVLLLMAAAGERSIYTWVLVTALLSDVADGWIARSFGLQSRLGARLDSLGDSLVWYAGLAGMFAFQRDVLAAHRWLFGAVVAAWMLENVLAWRRYGRLSSFHTVASKIAGVLLSFYIGVLFLFGHWNWLLWLAASASLLASAEELWLLALLPRWRADVKGVWWLRSVRIPRRPHGWPTS